MLAMFGTVADWLGSTRANWPDAVLHAVAILRDLCLLQDETKASSKDFDTNASILYLVSMSTFWILTLATGGSDRRAPCDHGTHNP